MSASSPERQPLRSVSRDEARERHRIAHEHLVDAVERLVRATGVSKPPPEPLPLFASFDHRQAAETEASAGWLAGIADAVALLAATVGGRHAA